MSRMFMPFSEGGRKDFAAMESAALWTCNGQNRHNWCASPKMAFAQETVSVKSVKNNIQVNRNGIRVL